MRRWLLCILLAGVSASAHAGRPALVVPHDQATVIERLPRGYAALMPSRQTIPPMAQIEQLLSTAARTGDARLAARADQVLQRIPATDTSAGVMKARAFGAQHRHDFAAALRILDATIAKYPRDGDARMSRAQIQLVQGRLDQARRDCATLALGVDADNGLVCIAALSQRTGAYGPAASLLDRWLARPSGDPDTRRYVLVMRGEIASRAGDADADKWFRSALDLVPDDVRTLAAFARHLRARGRDPEVLSLLANAPATDGLELQRALAAQRSGDPQAAALVEAQGRRYALAHDVGSQPEMRDEAEFLLTLRANAPAALALAQRNFESQRDYEDVDILRRAAIGAHRRDALAVMDRWARSQHLALAPVSAAQR